MPVSPNGCHGRRLHPTSPQGTAFMDELRRHAAPLVDRWQRFARGQRIAMVAVLVASAVGFFFLLSRSTESWQPIADGREFSTSELATIQSAWRQAGLKSFRRDARKLLVPSAEIARYTTALPKSQRDDGGSGEEHRPSITKANLFTSHEQLEQLKDHDLRDTLRRHLKAIPAIADADVIWARGKGRSAFASRSKVTATINVLPRDGHDLTPELAQSLRTAVAGMISDLSADDIVVLDQSTGLTISDDSDVLIAEQRRRQHERLARQLESRIAAALAHIPDATVHAKLVEVPLPTKRHTTAKPTFGSAIVWTTEASDNFVEFSPLIIADSDIPSNSADAATSCTWHVAVQIPQASFDAHVAQQLLTAEHRTTNPDDLCDAEYAQLRLLVRNLLPPDATLAELSIIPGTVTASATPATVPFAAWPHIVCGLLAVLCLTMTARSWRPDDVTPQASRSSDLSSPNVESLGELVLAAHSTDEDQVRIEPPNPIESLTDLARLQQLDPQTLADALRHERPQAIAVLLTRFSTRLASACLSRFAASLQTDVISRLKSLGEVPEELVAEIARAVCERMTPAAEPIAHEPINRIAHLLPETPTQRAFA